MWARSIMLAGIVLGAAAKSLAQPVTAAEMKLAANFITTHFKAEQASVPPFSFDYAGKNSRELLADWKREQESRNLDAARVRHVLSYVDAQTGLTVRSVAVEYRDYPVVEWTLYLKNSGTADTPILSNVCSTDIRLRREPTDNEFVLNHHTGDNCTPDSFAPHQLTLTPGASHRFASAGGRPTTGAFPYYNIQWSGQGVIAAIGWPGQWACRFLRDSDHGLRIAAGQELTHFKLLPGEEVRTPLFVLLFYEGDRLRSQNLWRRWMLDHNLPRLHAGEPPRPMLVFCSGGFFAGLKCNETDERIFIDALTARNAKPDYWWMDAGWYTCHDWPETGTWEPDPERFPHGIKGVSDYAHSKGMNLILWFEPERVTPGSWLYQTHPAWLLGQDGQQKLLNLGHPQARQWLTDHIDRFLTQHGVDLYRQDFNMDPLPYWRANDAPDRQGITEIRHVEGYLAYWDELRRRHPGMLIDSCSSGGRRNDLETLRRAVPLLRSDYQSFAGDPSFALGNQCHTYGLSFWFPFYGQGAYYNDNQLFYAARSHFSPSFGFCVDVRKPGIDWVKYRRVLDDWRLVSDSMLGDFYPLTPFSLTNDQWIAWQFDRPDLDKGVLQLFRRPQNEQPSMTLKLRGLHPEARYLLTYVDCEGPAELVGATALAKGLTLAIKDKPAAAIVAYRRAQPVPNPAVPPSR